VAVFVCHEYFLSPVTSTYIGDEHSRPPPGEAHDGRLPIPYGTGKDKTPIIKRAVTRRRNLKAGKSHFFMSVLYVMLHLTKQISHCQNPVNFKPSVVLASPAQSK
jgi:hypothetical protein